MDDDNGWALTVKHIAGQINIEAVTFSRLSLAGSYAIKKKVLHEVQKEWHT